MDFLLTYLPLVKTYAVWLPLILGALAIAWFFPPFRSVALAIAVGVIVGLSCFQYGDSTGAKRIQDQWDNSLVQEYIDGEAIRAEAEHHVRALPPDSVRTDPRNRDNWKK